MAAERLIRIRLANGGYIEFRRTEKHDVHVCDADHCVILPHGTGQQTLDLFALLEKFGEMEEVPNETHEETVPKTP